MEQLCDTREAPPNVEEPINIKMNEGRETPSNEEERLIIGRTKDKKKILSILSESSMNEIVILPIYGIGGIGKTTLAKLVFNDPRFSGYSRVWVEVSKTLDLNAIGNSIISQLTNKAMDVANIYMMKNHLAMLFSRKSILIVLDDLWENDVRKLDELKDMVSLGQGTKVILVTTRDEAIARNICNTVKNVSYKLDILTDAMCWTIIKQKSYFEDRHAKTHSVLIGRDIANKCGGVALAAQSLGYMLRDMTCDQWESVRDSDIWNLSTSEDPSLRIHEVLASLRLSYSHMHQWLQSCFSYCAVFGKGHRIVKHDLIHQWMALEFPEPSKIFDSMQLCEQYITDLLGLSFLQYSIGPSNIWWDEHTTFTMHDLVHDLATATLAGKVNRNGIDVGSSCQYALVRDPSKPLQSSVSSPENLKALHFLECAIIELSDHAISPAKCLRVLDLRGRAMVKLPDSLGQLKQLRYLHAPRIQDQIIPNCITELSKLNYLSLRGSRHIEALPDSIGDLKGLMHLDLSGCVSIYEVPVSFIALKHLVHLDLKDCRIPISKYLGSFTKLQFLDLSREVGFWKEKEKLAFNVLPDPEVLGKLKKLRHLNLAGCMNVMSEDDIQGLWVGISTLYNLQHLDLSHNDNLKCIPESIGNLTKLHTINLYGRYTKKLPAWMAKMASLKIINVSTLERCGSNLILFADANPCELKIRKLEDVKSLEEAQSIKLIEKQSIQYLEMDWTVGSHKRYVDDKDLLENLIPSNTVEWLRISGYRSPSFPTNWLMSIGMYLPYVSEITLEDFPNCNNLPQLSQLTNLRCLSLHRLHSLEELNTTDSCGEVYLHYLSILSCPKLRMKPCLPRGLSSLSINASDNILTSSLSEIVCSYLFTKLEITGSTLPVYEWKFLKNISALRELDIIDCIDLSSCSAEIIQHLSSLKSLNLKDNILTELPAWLVELTSLQRLTIRAPKLEKLNDSTRQLPAGLEILILSGCGSMVSLPWWLGELTSLEELTITECEGIRSFPGSIRELTELRVLWIEGYLMCSYEIRKILLSIPADTDEVDIQKLMEEYTKERAKAWAEDTSSESGTLKRLFVWLVSWVPCLGKLAPCLGLESS